MSKQTRRKGRYQVDDFSFGDWKGYAYKIQNKLPVVLFIHQKPLPYPYMVLSRTSELFFRTYREAQDHFKSIEGDN